MTLFERLPNPIRNAATLALACLTLLPLAAPADNGLLQTPEGELILARFELPIPETDDSEDVPDAAPTTLHLQIRGNEIVNLNAIKRRPDGRRVSDTHLHMGEVHLRLDAASLLKNVFLPEDHQNHEFGAALNQVHGPLYHAWDAESLQREGQRLHGNLIRNTWAEDAFGEPQTWALDFTFQEDGSIVATDDESPVGTWNTAETARSRDPVTFDYPARHGAAGNNHAPDFDTVFLVELSEATPLWWSEVRFGGGRDGWIDEIADGIFAPVHGGNATPVLGDGTLFLHHQRPNPGHMGRRDSLWGQVEPQPLLGDEGITAVDAATGAWLWSRVFPEAAIALHHGESEGKHNTGAFHNGRYFAMTHDGMLRALDGENGDVLWSREVEKFASRAQTRRAETLASERLPEAESYLPNLVLAPPALIVGEHAFRLEDGEPLWRQEGTPVLWNRDGDPRVLFLDGETIRCIRPADGEVLWTQPLGNIVRTEHSGVIVPRVIEDVLITRQSGFGDITLAGHRLTEDGVEKIWETERPRTIETTLPVPAPEGFITLDLRSGENTPRTLVLADLETGEELRTHGFEPETRHPELLSLGNRILIRADSISGDGAFAWHDSRGLFPIGDESWIPQTHARHDGGGDGPLGFLVADGRLFLRGNQRLVAYDLRVPPQDIEPLRVVGAFSAGNPERLLVNFNQLVEYDRAGDPARYQISDEIQVHAAEILPDGHTVELSVDPLREDVTYTLQVDGLKVLGGTGEALSDQVEFQHLAFAPLKVNFQDPDTDVPEGYLADVGEPFQRRDPYAFGWSGDVTGASRARGGGEDERYRTLLHFEGETWSAELPNGRYKVLLVCGDPSHTDQRNVLKVNGESVTDLTPENSNFDRFELIVTVTDNKLTLEPQPEGRNHKISYLHIAQTTED